MAPLMSTTNEGVSISNVVIMSGGSSELERHSFEPARFMNLSPTAVSYWDRDLLCRYANQTCADWFGVDPELLVGSCIETVWKVLRLEHHFELVDAALAGERRSIMQSFHEGLAKRDGFMQYIPDVRRHAISGLLIQVSPMPSQPRLVRPNC